MIEQRRFIWMPGDIEILSGPAVPQRFIRYPGQPRDELGQFATAGGASSDYDPVAVPITVTSEDLGVVARYESTEYGGRGVVLSQGSIDSLREFGFQRLYWVGYRADGSSFQTSGMKEAPPDFVAGYGGDSHDFAHEVGHAFEEHYDLMDPDVTRGIGRFDPDKMKWVDAGPDVVGKGEYRQREWRNPSERVADAFADFVQIPDRMTAESRAWVETRLREAPGWRDVVDVLREKPSPLDWVDQGSLSGSSVAPQRFIRYPGQPRDEGGRFASDGGGYVRSKGLDPRKSRVFAEKASGDEQADIVGSESVIARRMADEIGFSGLARVVSRAQMDAAVASGATETYRGVLEREHAEQLRTGTMRYSIGTHGSGLYVLYGSDAADQASEYASGERFSMAIGTHDPETGDWISPPVSGNGVLMRLALVGDAKVIDYEDAAVEREKAGRVFHNAAAQARTGDDAEAFAQAVAGGSQVDDVGLYAMTKGYDAIRFEARVPVVGVGDVAHSSFIVLNRTALLIQDEDAPVPKAANRSVAARVVDAQGNIHDEKGLFAKKDGAHGESMTPEQAMAIKDAEDRYVYQRTESASVIGPDGVVRFVAHEGVQPAETMGPAGQLTVDYVSQTFKGIQFTDEQLSQMHGAVLTHNHPDGWNWPASSPKAAGTSLSILDVGLAVKNDLAEIRSVSRGATFSLRPGPDGWKANFEELSLTSYRASQDVYGEFYARWRDGYEPWGRSKSHRWDMMVALHADEVVSRLADHYGWEYTVERHDPLKPKSTRMIAFTQDAARRMPEMPGSDELLRLLKSDLFGRQLDGDPKLPSQPPSVGTEVRYPGQPRDEKGQFSTTGSHSLQAAEQVLSKAMPNASVDLSTTIPVDVLTIDRVAAALDADLTRWPEVAPNVTSVRMTDAQAVGTSILGVYVKEDARGVITDPTIRMAINADEFVLSPRKADFLPDKYVGRDSQGRDIYESDQSATVAEWDIHLGSRIGWMSPGTDLEFVVTHEVGHMVEAAYSSVVLEFMTSLRSDYYDGIKPSSELASLGKDPEATLYPNFASRQNVHEWFADLFAMSERGLRPAGYEWQVDRTTELLSTIRERAAKPYAPVTTRYDRVVVDALGNLHDDHTGQFTRKDGGGDGGTVSREWEQARQRAEDRRPVTFTGDPGLFNSRLTVRPFTEVENGAVGDYVYGSMLNDALLEGSGHRNAYGDWVPGNPAAIRDNEDQIKAMDSAFTGNATTGPITVFRGTGVFVFRDILGEDRDGWIGQVVGYPGYMSTSKVDEVASHFIDGDDPCLIQITIPGGSPAIWIDAAMTQRPNELEAGDWEILLPRDTKLQVTGVVLDNSDQGQGLITVKAKVVK